MVKINFILFNIFLETKKISAVLAVLYSWKKGPQTVVIH